MATSALSARSAAVTISRDGLPAGSPLAGQGLVVLGMHGLCCSSRAAGPDRKHRSWSEGNPISMIMVKVSARWRWPSLAPFSSATQKPAHRAGSGPPPSAWPVTAATTGLAILATTVKAARRRRPRTRPRPRLRLPGPRSPASRRPAATRQAGGLGETPHPGRLPGAGQERVDLSLVVAAVPAERPDRAELALLRPPGDRLGVDPQERGHLGRGQKAVGLHIWPHHRVVLSPAHHRGHKEDASLTAAVHIQVVARSRTSARRAGRGRVAPAWSPGQRR